MYSGYLCLWNSQVALAYATCSTLQLQLQITEHAVANTACMMVRMKTTQSEAW